MEKERRTKALLLSTLVVVVATLSIAFAAMSRTLNFSEKKNGETKSFGFVLSGINRDSFLSAEDASKETFFNGSLARNEIESISFLNVTEVPNKYQSIAWDASQKNDGSVIAWYEDINSNSLKEVFVGAKEKIFAPQDSSLLFSFFTSLKEINFNGVFDTSKTTNMYGMFGECSSLISIDLDSFDTRKVINMEDMFSGCTFLKNINLNSFDTSNVMNMNNMFMNCQSLTSINLKNFNTHNVTTMSGLFSGCSMLSNVNLSSFDTSKVTDMSWMFSSCKSLENINLSSFNTKQVKNMKSMFANCSSLINLDLSNFYTPKLEDINYIFAENNNLTKIDLTNADFSKVVEGGLAFYKVKENNITIIVNETQKELATDIFITSHYGTDNDNLTIFVISPGELKK